MGTALVIWSAIGSAVGGFLGVILFFGIRYRVSLWHARPELIKEYFCATEQNYGQATEFEGEIMHHHGEIMKDASQLSYYAIDHPVWKWSRSFCGKDRGSSLFYGPYSTDICEPGVYVAIFCMRGAGFAKPSELQEDCILLEFDVCRTIADYALLPTGVATFANMQKVARRFVRASDLAQKKWVSFEIPFYSQSGGIYEYRCEIYDGLDGKPDNLSKYGTNINLLFDKVSIMKKKPFSMIKEQ